jgi:hypothetical protein
VPVIPREGVESLVLLEHILREIGSVVIPREGVESDARARSASFTFTSVIPREGVERYDPMLFMRR